MSDIETSTPAPAPVVTAPIPEAPTPPATVPTTVTLQPTDPPLEGTPKHRSLIQELEAYIHDGEEEIKVGAADILAWLKKHL